MERSSLFSLPDGLEIASVVGTSDLLTVYVIATTPMGVPSLHSGSHARPQLLHALSGRSALRRSACPTPLACSQVSL